MNKNNCNNRLTKIISQMYNDGSVMLSSFDKETIECIQNLRLIEEKNVESDTLEKYKYFDEFFLLKVLNDYYIINSKFIGSPYYPGNMALEIRDFNIFLRKDKLENIKSKISK